MSQNIFCPQCGSPARAGQKFCEMCGAKLPQSQPQNQQNNQGRNQPRNQQIYQARNIGVQPPGGIPFGLFDPQHNAYVVKEKFWDWGSGPIYDVQGRQIGKMHRRFFSLREKIEFQEMNGAVVAAIQKKIVSFRPAHTLLDQNGNVIARMEKTLLSLIHPKFYLKDPVGNIIMTAYGNFMGFDFTIYRGQEQNPNNIIAEIHKADRWRDVFFSGLWDFKDTYGVQIIRQDVDRRLILGLVIAIDNVLHDKK